MNLNAENVFRTAAAAVLLAARAFAADAPAASGTAAAPAEKFLAGAVSAAISRALQPLQDKGIDTLYMKTAERHAADFLVEDAVYAQLKDAVPVIRTADGLAKTASVVPAAVTAGPGSTAAAGSTGTAAVATAPPDTAVLTVTPSRPGHSGYVLEYRVADAGVALGAPSRRGWFGPRQAVRTARADCRFRLLELPGYTVVWTGAGTGAAEETAAMADITAGASRKFAYEQAAVGRPLWKTGIETVLAGGTVGALMFLFFTQSFN